MVYRCILADWKSQESPDLSRVVEGELDPQELRDLNDKGYNIYYLPNYPSFYPGGNVDGSQIDTFEWVFIDIDFKDGVYGDVNQAINALTIRPNRIVSTGNGVHVYWRVTDLDAMSYLRLTRRLARLYNSDLAVGKIHQLMRYPGYNNTKAQGEPKPCSLDFEDLTETYTAEELDQKLPVLTPEDEQFCTQHYGMTNGEFEEWAAKVEDKLPAKWGEFLSKCSEAKEIMIRGRTDRSGGDYRLGLLMHSYGFTREEAAAVLRKSAKVMDRLPIHQLSYARNIIDKIWTYALETPESLTLHKSVREVLLASADSVSGQRFECHKFLDNTDKGWRLGQVIGLVGGSGVGKTTLAMNMFKWFAELNPGYDHFFVSLEQPAREIAERWQTVCQENTALHDSVHIIENYDDKGITRLLSLEELQDYILKFKKVTGKRVGAVVIDHIGALKKKTRDGENQGIIEICHAMKGFAIATDTMVVMQSQAPREKAGIGDLELNKDAAYGTVFFESYCDYLMGLWQPLKRVYHLGAPTVMAFKFCKIRHKKQGKDKIQEDVCYRLFFDPLTEQLRSLTETEEKSFDFFANQANNLRKKDRNEATEYVSRKEDGTDAISNSADAARASSAH